MILVASDMRDNPKEIRDFLANVNGLKVYIVHLDRFKENLRGDIDLIIYDTYNLSPGDVKNIHLAKEAGIPLLLISAYPEKWTMDEISRLWRHNLIKDYLIKPVEVERLAVHLPSLGLDYKYIIVIGVFSLFLAVGFKGLSHTNKIEFCISCHSMKFPYSEEELYRENLKIKEGNLWVSWP